MSPAITRVVMFSGGIGSWAAARRVVDRHGTDGVVLLFADTLIEDADLYRFLDEAAQDIGVPLTRIAEGRTPWEVFRDVRFLGNTRVDPCSRVLKRDVIDDWLAAHCDPARTVCYVGIDWTEEHRFKRLQPRRAAEGWTYEAPLCEAPYLRKDQMLAALTARGIKPPRLYALGFPHNNCGGACIKAGQAHFAHLLRVLPEVYAEWERNEDALRAQLGDVSILRDRTGGEARPLSLREFRERLSRQAPLFDQHEWGGCGCFAGSEVAR